MPENTISIRLPALPDPEIFKDPDRSIRTIDGGAIVTYDPATRAGFVYQIKSDLWLISAPIDFSAFAATLALAGHAVADCDDSRRWVAACCAPPAGISRH